VAPPPDIVPGPIAAPGSPEDKTKLERPAAAPFGYWDIHALKEDLEEHVHKLRGRARLENGTMLFQADEIDWDENTGEVQARGNVYFQHFDRNERLWCDHLEYNTDEQTGKFYDVIGEGQNKVVARPHVLTSTSPYHFEGEWAERIGEKYILYEGWITNCKVPHPWWIMRGPKFDIIPGDRAIAYKSIFRLKGIPLFYTPYFYHSLKKVPRRSGLLRPTIGNSSALGRMVELGYFWAINRSYDATYRFQDFTSRGFGHHIDFRGKPTDRADFDAIFFGVQDRGVQTSPNTVQKASGFSVNVLGKADLGDGFFARAQIDYLSSLNFQQQFTQSFTEAIGTEANTIIYVTKHWDYYSFDAAFERRENFQSINPGDDIIIRKLPEVDFSSRDQQILGNFPLWVSFDSAAGLLQRSEPLFQTRQFTPRMDLFPRLVSAFHWKGIDLVPSFGVRETFYGESQQNGVISGLDINRFAHEFSLDVILPSLARVFNKKTFLGDKLKHVIEPRASFTYVGGIDNFNRIIRFDETDIMNDTKEAEISLINRLYAKRGDDVTEILTWELFQRRYFDPTFGGALIPGLPYGNVLLSTVDITPFPFLEGPRVASPVVSLLQARPVNGLGIQWRTDYDPGYGGIVENGFDADVRFGKYFLQAGHNLLRGNPLLNTPANQFHGQVGWGNENRRGWNFSFQTFYDYLQGRMQFAATQVNYNTDCCGITVQFRRFSFGLRNENQFLVSFSVANLGSFGNLKKQDRMF
jgi:LPS-assembly protein